MSREARPDQPAWDQMTIPTTLARLGATWPDVSAVEEGDVEARASRASRLRSRKPHAPSWRRHRARGSDRHLGAERRPLDRRGPRPAIRRGCARHAEHPLQGRRGGLRPAKSEARLLCTVGDFLGMNYADVIAAQDLPALEGILLLDGESPNGTTWDAFLARGASVTPAAATARAAEVEARRPLRISSSPRARPEIPRPS